MIRAFNQLLGFFFGLALAAAGVVTIVEAVCTGVGDAFVWIPGRAWRADFRTTPWSATIVLGVSAAVGALGLVLFLLEVRPTPRRGIRVRVEGSDWVVVKRSTESHVARRLRQRVPGSALSVRLQAGVPAWTMHVTGRAPDALRSQLQEAGEAELARLHAPEGSQVSVRTRPATAPPYSGPDERAQ